MKLRGMAHALVEQMERGDLGDMAFGDRLDLLVDREWTVRQDRCFTRRLQTARLKFPEACTEDIDYRHPRELDKGQIQDLATCRWLAARRNVVITGATGLGKTWLACALANRACRDGFTALYLRVPKLLEELLVARADGSYLKMLASLARVDLLVLDDWGLAPIDGVAQHCLLEVVDDRVGTRSTIVTSQLPIDKWHGTIGDPSVADAMLDRIITSSSRIALSGTSMRGKARKA